MNHFYLGVGHVANMGDGPLDIDLVGQRLAHEAHVIEGDLLAVGLGLEALGPGTGDDVAGGELALMRQLADLGDEFEGTSKNSSFSGVVDLESG